jgi:branched-chain amino acid aminotransferase
MSELKYHMINGVFVPVEAASLHISDLSILRGYAIFDYFRVRKGKAIFMEDHLERFFRSAKLIGLPIPYSYDEVQQMIEGLIKKNGVDKFSIRLQLTGGYSDNGFAPGKPNLFLLSVPFPVLPQKYYLEGWHVLTVKFQREIPEVKTTNYLTGIHILPLLEKNKAHAPLYHDGTFIRESDRSNFFIVNEAGVLVTPKDKILLGVSRKITLKVAKGLIKTEERDITLEELRSSKEMFLTSSTKPIIPVTKLDGKIVGDGKLGKITKELMGRFQEYIEDYLNR